MHQWLGFGPSYELRVTRNLHRNQSEYGERNVENAIFERRSRMFFQHCKMLHKRIHPQLVRGFVIALGKMENFVLTHTRTHIYTGKTHSHTYTHTCTQPRAYICSRLTTVSCRIVKEFSLAGTNLCGFLLFSAGERYPFPARALYGKSEQEKQGPFSPPQMKLTKRGPPSR